MINKKNSVKGRKDTFRSHDEAMTYLFPRFYQLKKNEAEEKEAETVDKQKAMHRLAESVLKQF